MSANVSFFFLLLARLSGLFLFSPFLKRLGIVVRFLLSLACAFAFLPFFSHKPAFATFNLLFNLTLIKEILIGYFVGFLFSLLIEAGAFAGELIAPLGGFSFSRMLADTEEGDESFFSTLFSLTLLILFFSLDLHHFLLRLIYESFSLFPPSSSIFQENFLHAAIHATGKMFDFALSYALYPFTLLLCLNVLLALLARDYVIFLNGFPIQMLLTLIILALAISSFDKILFENFSYLFSLIKKTFFRL